MSDTFDSFAGVFYLLESKITSSISGTNISSSMALGMVSIKGMENLYVRLIRPLYQTTHLNYHKVLFRRKIQKYQGPPFRTHGCSMHTLGCLNLVA